MVALMQVHYSHEYDAVYTGDCKLSMYFLNGMILIYNSCITLKRIHCHLVSDFNVVLAFCTPISRLEGTDSALFVKKARGAAAQVSAVCCSVSQVLLVLISKLSHRTKPHGARFGFGRGQSVGHLDLCYSHTAV
jgi:hypothetical protein